MRSRNLNDLTIDGQPIGDVGPLVAGGARVSVYFRDIRNGLLDAMDRWPVMFGCVAWLTDPVILAIAARKMSAFVVQKEDYLRQDAGRWFKPDLRRAYDKIVGLYSQDFHHPGLGMQLATARDEVFVDLGVRCFGHRSVGDLSTPRMHHKFIVFGDIVHDGPDPWDRRIDPQAVWTGSSNLTYTASQSMENGVLIESENIATAFQYEFAQIALMSEPLDWTSDSPTPEWCEP